jgi:RecA-family ATPase
MKYDHDEVRRLIYESSSPAADEHWRDGMISARQLCAMRFAPLKFIVPKIIPEGLTILAGRPKIGKSWLVLLLGIVLSSGVAALGLDYGMTMPLKGSVLYLGLEDGKRRLQRRMTKLVGIRPENWPEQLYLKTEWRRFDQGGLDDIRAWYSAAKAKGETPVLVIIDTLAKVRAPGSSKSSPYQNDHDALAGLQRLAEELGIAVVVNHHDRKMDAEDVFDTVSGTLGLTGAVDTILVLAKKRRGRPCIFAAGMLKKKLRWPCASIKRPAGGQSWEPWLRRRRPAAQRRGGES